MGACFNLPGALSFPFRLPFPFPFPFPFPLEGDDKDGVGGVGGGGIGDPVYNDMAIYTLSSFALHMAHNTYI